MSDPSFKSIYSSIYSKLLVAVVATLVTTVSAIFTGITVKKDAAASALQAKQDSLIDLRARILLANVRQGNSGDNQLVLHYIISDSAHKTVIVYDTVRRLVVDTSSTIPAKDVTKPVLKDFIVEKFWLKVAFSGIFLGAALFVILSNKYDETTRKWAYTVLTLIAGVWIGAATS